MNKTDIEKTIKSSSLFKNVSAKTIQYAVDKCNILECQKNDTFDTQKSSLFIILKGKASVYGVSKNKPVILNTLSIGRLFGMASLFGDNCGMTVIKAKENCTYAVLSQSCVEEMLKNDIVFTKNYISFLSDKIRFLNKKIAFFTSGSAEKTVAGYILSLPINEDNAVKIEMSLSKLSQHLDIGRASLYRALDSLEENGFISRNNNIIKITSPEEFKKIYGETLWKTQKSYHSLWHF